MDYPKYTKDQKSLKDVVLPSDTDTQALLVAALKVVQAAKEATRLPDGSLPPIFPAGDLVFELAKLHTSTMGKLAEIASTQATKLLEHTQQARTGGRGYARQGGYAGQSMRVLVEMEMAGDKNAEKPVTLRNKSATARTFAVPEIVELVSVQDGKPCEENVEYEQIQFAATSCGAALDEIEVCAKTSQKPGEKVVHLSIPSSKRL